MASRRWTQASLAVAALLLLMASSAPARADVLMVVSELDDAGEHFWWSQPKSPELGRFETLMSTLSAERAPMLIDPRQVEAPSVSQVVFGRAELGVVNAINLASLYGASRVIHGQLRVEQCAAAPMLSLVGVRVSVELHVHATQSAIELLSVQLDETRYARSKEQAEQAALAAAGARIVRLFEQSGALQPSDLRIEVGEPVLLLSGMQTARPLVDVKKALKSSELVVDVVERWSTEGAIALELNPAQVDEPSFVFEQFERALRETYLGFTLQELQRDDERVEVLVLTTNVVRE
jgi:hypothetical protein